MHTARSASGFPPFAEFWGRALILGNFGFVRAVLRDCERAGRREGPPQGGGRGREEPRCQGAARRRGPREDVGVLVPRRGAPRGRQRVRRFRSSLRLVSLPILAQKQNRSFLWQYDLVSRPEIVGSVGL